MGVGVRCAATLVSQATGLHSRRQQARMAARVASVDDVQAVGSLAEMTVCPTTNQSMP